MLTPATHWLTNRRYGEYRVHMARTDSNNTESVIALVAIANIKAGEEILVDYH